MKPEEGKTLLEGYKIPYTDVEGIPVVDMNDLTIEQKEAIAIMRETELNQQIYTGVCYVSLGGWPNRHDSEYLTMEGRGIMRFFDEKLMIIKND